MTFFWLLPSFQLLTSFHLKNLYCFKTGISSFASRSLSPIPIYVSHYYLPLFPPYSLIFFLSFVLPLTHFSMLKWHAHILWILMCFKMPGEYVSLDADLFAFLILTCLLFLTWDSCVLFVRWLFQIDALMSLFAPPEHFNVTPHVCRAPRFLLWLVALGQGNQPRPQASRHVWIHLSPSRKTSSPAL